MAIFGDPVFNILTVDQNLSDLVRNRWMFTDANAVSKKMEVPIFLPRWTFTLKILEFTQFEVQPPFGASSFFGTDLLRGRASWLASFQTKALCIVHGSDNHTLEFGSRAVP